MNVNHPTGRTSRALRPGVVLLLAAAVAVACESEEATTGPGTVPAPSSDVVTTEAGFGVAGARTEAEIGLTRSGAEAVQVEFEAMLEEVPELAGADVVATWEQAGGISPQPFVVSIPAGCLMSNAVGLHVEDFRTCGVTAALGEERVSLMEFDARLVADRDGTGRLELEALMGISPTPFAPQLLGTLGGGVVELAIGAESAGVPPLGIETVSGIDPQPF